MTNSLTPDSPEKNPSFEHVAVFYDGVDELVAVLVDDIAAAVDDGERVLVCIELEAWKSIENALGDRAADVTYLADDVRYSKPAEAMRAVHEFAELALADGATAVRSIGIIPLDGHDDDNWIRYEAAVNDVLAHMPFKGVCLYDTSTVSAEVARDAAAAHLSVIEGGQRRTQPVDATRHPTVPALEPPPRTPDITNVVESSSTARRTIRELLAGVVSDARLADVLLVTSELVTNGLTDGEQPVEIAVWLRPGRDVHVAVTDRGTGIDDPFFDLRPPPPDRVGGAGLWIVGQLAARVDSRMKTDGTHRVVARLTVASDR